MKQQTMVRSALALVLVVGILGGCASTTHNTNAGATGEHPKAEHPKGETPKH
jgi:hypothetical protein